MMMESLTRVVCVARWEQSMGAAPSFATPRGGGKQRAMSLAARRIVGELEEGMGDDKERNSLLAFAEMLENRGSASGRSRGALTAHIFFVSLSLSLLLLLSWVVVPVLITFCVLSLAPILGCAVLLPSSRRAAASIKHGQLSPVTRAHQHSSPIKNTPGGHISSRPRTPCAQAQNPE